MNLLTIKNMSKAYTDKVLFDGIDFSLEEGEKVGIVGINGTGKSTFLKIVAGLLEADGGEYTKGSNVVISYLPQNPDFSEEMSILEYVVGANKDENEAFGVEGKAKTMLNKLGFTDYDISVTNLSGGQKKKVALAGVLLSKNEVLILDEPTNHLDNEMNEWLEKWLREYRGAVIMVTHDRYFLDLVCNRIDEFDKGKLYSYHENYEGFLRLKAEREEMALSTQKKHENILRKEIAWIQRGAKARSTKQKARIERYEELRDEKKVVFDGEVSIGAISERLGKKTIELYNIGKEYNGRKIINDFTYNFLRDDKVGILGPNGCGKSTLVKIIEGQLSPSEGRREVGETVRIGYYAQDCEAMDPGQKVIDYIKDKAEYIRADDRYISAAQMLENFLFEGSIQYSPIEKLSGGERRRLYLARVLMEAPNVLILDEPTNDLDIATLQVLEDYLDSFSGILIVVSHDRYFLDRVTRRMLTFEENGKIKLFNGSYTDYYLEKAEASEGKTANARNGDGAKNYKEQKAQNKKNRLSYNEQREYESIEGEIEKLESRIKEIEKQIADPANSTDFVKLTKLSEEKEESDKLLEEKYERYMYLTEKIEEFSN